MKRYIIQVKDVLSKEDWEPLYIAKSFRTVRGAKKEWWHWVNKKWSGDLVMLRVWDTKEGKPVE